MFARTLKRVKRRPLRWGFVIACTLLAVGLGIMHLTGFIRWTLFASELEASIDPPRSGETIEVAWSFPFQSGRCMVDIQLDQADLDAAEAVRTSAVFGSRGWLRDRYVSHLVQTQAESRVIDTLAEEFRRLRLERHLDNDEYLELMTAAIQHIPYGEVCQEIKLPAQVLATGSGVCTEKSILLGALLVHENYDTVMWVFETQHHVALGVASESARFRDTPYAFIESTAPGYVGMAESAYWAPGPTARRPRTIALGSGRSYAAGGQVEVILAELSHARAVKATSKQYRRFARTAGRYRDRFAERAQAYEAANVTAAFILGNTHDRQGVYAILSGSGVADVGSPQLLMR
jgi:hypothetical protein